MINIIEKNGNVDQDVGKLQCYISTKLTKSRSLEIQLQDNTIHQQGCYNIDYEAVLLRSITCQRPLSF